MDAAAVSGVFNQRRGDVRPDECGQFLGFQHRGRHIGVLATWQRLGRPAGARHMLVEQLQVGSHFLLQALACLAQRQWLAGPYLLQA